MNLSKQITKINLNSTNGKFAISTNEDQIDEAEAVIVTIPVPHVLSQLQGSITQLIGTYQILLNTFSVFFLQR